MAEFMLLFRGGDPKLAGFSPDELQKYLDRWRAWSEDLRERGVFLQGRPLETEPARTVSAGGLVSDGPFPESKEMVGGFIAVEVEDVDQAIEIAKQCPIYECDGQVEVRMLRPGNADSCQ